MTQTIIVAVIVAVAVAWVAWLIVRQARQGGCASCDAAGSCPHAGKRNAPPQAAEDPEVCDQIREEQATDLPPDP